MLKENDKIELYDIMDKTNRFMKRNDIKYFLTCGTLLGAVRHKGIIPYDKDIDIAMFEDEFQKLKDKQTELKQFGLVLDYRDQVWRINKENSCMYIDVFVYTKIDDKYMYVQEKNRDRWPDEYVYEDEIHPLRELQFGENMLYVPNKYENVLQRFYGDDYMTPYYFAQGSDDWIDKIISYNGRKVYD